MLNPTSKPLPLIFELLNPLPAMVQSHVANLACKAVNHLLRLEPSVQVHLKPHVGRTVLLRWESLGLAPAGEQALRIEPNLSISPALIGNPSAIDVTVSLQSGIINAPVAERLRFVRLEGDILLAQDLSRVAKELRWDAEHDLARVIGDAPAYWIVKQAKAVTPHLQGAVQQFAAQAQVLAARFKPQSSPASSSTTGAQL